MDEYNSPAPPTSILVSNEENMNSAPPLFQTPCPSEDEIILNKETKETPTEGDDDNNNENNNNYNNEEKDNEKNVPMKQIFYFHYYKTGKYRIISQYICCILLYACSIFGISLNCVYGVDYTLIDDLFLFILSSLMLYLTINQRSTYGSKLGLCSVLIWLIGSVSRVLCLLCLSKGKELFSILMIIRIIVLIPTIFLNYYNFCQC